MSLGVLDAHETAEGLAVTFITDYGLEPLEGSRDEVARLAAAMQQVSVLASLNDNNERVWVQDVTVGRRDCEARAQSRGTSAVRILRH